MKKILFTGGSTGGPTIPLIAIYQELMQDHPDWQYFWLGTHSGPEKKIVSQYDIKFRSIAAAKFTRHLSLKLLLQPFLFILGLIQSAVYLLIWRPHIILSVGGYVSVPVVIEGWALHIPSLIHQQDLQPGLANRIMSFFAEQVTVSVPELVNEFPGAKVIGNPVRPEIFNYIDKTKTELLKTELKDLSIDPDLPLLVVTGGGTGAVQINDLIIKALPELTKFCQVIHLTGKNRGPMVEQTNPNDFNNYQQFEFLGDEYLPLIAAADLVISRAGMSALTELAILGKPAIIIPMPNSHQEKNVQYFANQKAVKPLNIDYDFSEADISKFINIIKNLINSEEKQQLTHNIKKIFPLDASLNIINIIKKIF